MKRFLESRLPPGYAYKTELYAVAGAFLWAALSCVARFFYAYARERRQLYVRRGADLFLDETRVMPDFAFILGDKLLAPIVFAAVIFIGASAYHYFCYISGGKSIYTMRRLPNGFELHRRSLTVPLLCALAHLLLVAALLLVFYAVYMRYTPEACIAPGQWQKIWSVL